MKTKDQIIVVLIGIIAFGWLIYSIKSILPPFVLSFIIAYFLNPLVNFLNEKTRMNRVMATLLVMISFFAFVVVIFMTLIPLLYSQAVSLIEVLPSYYEVVMGEFYPKIVEMFSHFGIKMDESASGLISGYDFNEKFFAMAKDLVVNAAVSLATLVNVISLIFIMPILVFYLLKDWEKVIVDINAYLPKALVTTIRKIMADIDTVLSGYVRGQFNVCLILAIIYSVFLTIAGLNFGFTIGFLTGVLSFIPYVGMLTGVVMALLAALFQWGFDFFHISFVLLIFLFGQVIESNFLTPKIIGNRVGLSPVWIIFGLFVFGALFGFLGLLIAVPLTAVCGVIFKHFALLYKKKYT